MKRNIAFVTHLLVSSLFVPVILLAGTTKATLYLHAPRTLYPFTKIFLVGTFNGWNPADSSFVMTQLSKGNYSIQFNLPAGATIEYKYTLGSWDGVEKAADGSERSNRKILMRQGLIQQDTVLRWAIEAVNRGYWKYEELEPFQSSYILRTFGAQIQDAHTPTEIDSVIKAAQIGWSKHAVKYHIRSQSLPQGTSVEVPSRAGKQNIGGGGFTAQLYVYFIIDPHKRAIDPERWLYIASNYAIPAFIDEYPFLWKDPNSTKAFRIVASETIFNAVTAFSLFDEQWHELQKISEKMPQLIDLYLSRKLYKRPDVRDALERLESRLIAERPLWRTMDEMQRGRRDIALALLKTDILTNREDSIKGRAQVALRLFSQCLAAHENERGLDLLDFLTTSTNDGFVPRDSIKIRYLLADPSDGSRRFEDKIKSRPRFTLIAKDTLPQLTGRYLDVTTGTIVHLDTLRGRYVMVDVWTSWCMACRSEMPELKAFVEQMRGRPDFEFISVCGDSVVGGTNGTEIRRLAGENRLNFPVLFDVPENSLIQRWHVYGFPTKLLFDERGRLLRGANDHLTLIEANSFLQDKTRSR